MLTKVPVGCASVARALRHPAQRPTLSGRPRPSPHTLPSPHLRSLCSLSLCMSSLWYSPASALFFSCWRFFRLLRARLRCRAAGVTSLGGTKGGAGSGSRRGEEGVQTAQGDPGYC